MHGSVPLPSRSAGTPAGLLLPLVPLADWLFWDQSVGVSLAVFAVALVATVYAALPARPHPLAEGEAALVLLLGVLPVVERAQALSVLILLVSVAVAALRLRGGARVDWEALVRAAWRLTLAMPWRWAVDGARWLLSRDVPVGDVRSAAQLFIVPGALGFVFVLLIVAANPVIEDWLSRGSALRIDGLRLAFWGLVAGLAWPLVAARVTVSPSRLPRRIPETLLSGESVAHSLTLFNVLFAVQTSLDLTYLWSGSALPDGMTYAEYAHRGAYPLVALAMLAGLFCLAARPFTDERPDLRVLLALWLAQTAFLTAGSLWRLVLYIEAYGLTYLRVRAAIWMLLVAFGLGLLAWQLWKRRNAGWVLARLAVGTAVVFYACAFVNFAGLIAGWNLAEGRMHKVDLHYAWQLGPDAIVPIRAFEAPTGQTLTSRPLSAPTIDGWRDWDFRTVRIQRRLAAMEAAQ